MFKHLKNFLELILYAALSCGISFISRILPQAHTPLLFFRLGMLAYFVYVWVAMGDDKRASKIIIFSIFLGWLGGYWDYIEIYLYVYRYNIFATLSLICLILLIGLIFLTEWHRKIQKQETSNESLDS